MYASLQTKLALSLITCLSFFFCVKQSLSQTPDSTCPEVIWKKSFGGSDDDALIDILELSDGNYAVCGVSNSEDIHLESDMIAGDDAWVLKMDQDGNVLWSYTYGTEEERYFFLEMLATLDGGMLLCGSVREGVGGIAGLKVYGLVLRLDSNGEVLWVKKTEKPNQNDDNTYLGNHFWAIHPAIDGGFLVAGAYSDYYGPSEDQLLSASQIYKIDEFGNTVWNRFYYYPFGDFIFDMAANEIWDILSIAESGYLSIGYALLPISDVPKVWMMRTDDEGALLWQKLLDFPDNTKDVILEPAADGRLLLGTATYQENFNWPVQNQVSKMDEEGNIIWQTILTHPERELMITEIVTHPAGGCFAMGFSVKESLGVLGGIASKDYLVYYLDSEGEVVWLEEFGGSERDDGRSAMLTSDQHLVIGGTSASSDGDVTDHINSHDAWIIKLRAYPAYTLTNDTTVCDFPLELSVSGNNLEAVWETDENGLTYTATDTGLYRVMIMENFCKGEDSIQIKQVDFFALDLGPDTTLCGPDVLELNAAIPVEATYLWQDGTTSPVYEVNRPGQYFVDVTIDECTKTSTIEVDWCENCLDIPNVFTPNNDGVNDFFRPIPGCPIQDMTYQVYNRWGELVFTSSDYQTGWDGRVDGKLAPSDVYVYLVQYKTYDAEQYQVEKGDLTLLR